MLLVSLIVWGLCIFYLPGMLKITMWFLVRKKGTSISQATVKTVLFFPCMRVCVCARTCVCARMCACTLSCVWLFVTPMGCNLPRLFVHGIFQTRILEWVASSSFRGSSWPGDWTRVSCVSCTGRQVLYHCTTWEASFIYILYIAQCRWYF